MPNDSFEELTERLLDDLLRGIFELLREDGWNPTADFNQIIVTFNPHKHFVIFIQADHLCLAIDNDYGNEIGSDMQILWIFPIAAPTACETLLKELESYKKGRPVYLSDT